MKYRDVVGRDCRARRPIPHQRTAQTAESARRHSCLWQSVPTRLLDSAAAFNLIEVTMAVAIVGVSMLAIIGLLAHGISSSRSVSDDTLVANLADDMLNWSRVSPYTNQSWFPSGSSLTNHSEIITNTQMDANGNLPWTDSGYTNRLWAGNWSKTNGYYRFIRRPLDYPGGVYGGSDISRVLVIVEWPINPATGVPLTNTSGQVQNRRVFVGQVARR